MAKENKRTNYRQEQYNPVQIGNIKVCSTNKGLKEVAFIASELIIKQQDSILLEQQGMLDYIG